MSIEVKQCRHGRFMYYANDTYIGRCLSAYGEYSEDEVALWQQLVKPGWLVVDVGSNIGVHTVWFAKQVGPRGGVMAVEPQRQMYQMMCGNLALNELANVTVLLGALSDTDGVTAVPVPDYVKGGNFGGVALRETSHSAAQTVASGRVDHVPMVRFDTITAGRPDPQFIKVDAEGMEVEVLKGAHEVITRAKPVLYVENDLPEKSRGLIAHIMGLDYRLFWHVAKMFRADNFAGSSENIFPGIMSGVNMLCIHASLKPSINGLVEIRTPDDVSGVGR